jgi:hypothetical protein
MAVVGEARITVYADTSKVKEQIRKGFHGATAEAQKASEEVSKAFNKGIDKGLTSSTDAFRKLRKESEQLASGFARTVRRSYLLQAGLGALIQSVSALGGGLLALAGNLAGAGSAGIALVGIMAQLKVASMVGKQAFSGVMQAVKAGSTAASGTTKTIRELKEEMQQLAFAAESAALGEEKAAINLEKAREALARAQNLPPDNRARREAELAYQEADLAFRKAKDRNADLQEEIANPKKKAGSGGAANDPFKELTATQKKFAQYLITVQPRMKELKEAAASSFLPELTRQMQEMFRGGFFDMLVKGFEDVSKGLAVATKGFAGTLFDPRTKNNMAEFFKNSATTVGTLGGTLGKAFGGFLTLMRAIQPLISRFTLFLDAKADKFGKNMQENFVGVMAFFKDAGDAAAGWGAILGRLFEKFKGLIKANVGPGTGGQLLLDFFNTGTVGFRNLDGAAGEFARKQHFLAAATNLKAILQSLSKIFGFMTDLGTDPAVAVFWDTLSELETPLQEIFASIQGSTGEFAKLLVTIVEIIATFADAAQLEAYLATLNGLLKGLLGFALTIAPLMEKIGFLVGAFGALVTATLLYNKIGKIVAGTFLLLSGRVAAVTKVIKIYRTAILLNTAAESFGARAKAGFLMLLKKESLFLAFNQLRLVFSAKARMVDAALTAAQGDASLIASKKAKAFSIAINSAIWPLTLIALAIAAVIAVIIALVSWMNQIKADNIKKANKALDKSFESTKGKIVDATDAQKQWTAALLSVNDSAKVGISNIEDLGKALNNTNPYWDLYGTKTKAATEALGVYMGNLAKVGKKNLPELQKNFRNLAVSSEFTREGAIKAIKTNKAFTDTLEKHAKSLGDTIMNADGTVDAMKALDYAIGEGAYTARRAVIDQQKFAKAFKDAALSFIDTNDAMQKATTEGKFSLSTYRTELEKQAAGLTKWRNNITTLKGLFTNKDELQRIIAQGVGGAQLVSALAEGGQAEVDKYTKAMKATRDATKEAEQYAKATGSTDAIFSILKARSRGIAKAAQEDIAEGFSVFELQTKYKINDEALMAAQARLDASGVDLVKQVDLTAAWDEGNLAEVKKKLQEGIGKVVLRVDDPKAKDGGQANGGRIVKRALGGLVGRFADGFGPRYNGRVSGPGTARSDQIPAMISNGEYVVNARATAQNLALLNAINANKNVSGMGGGINVVVNAAPGMDEQQVASLVAHQLRTEMRKGATI